MGKFDRWNYSKQEQIFTDEERKEIWTVIKQAVSGRISDSDLKKYIDVLNKAIESHTVRVGSRPTSFVK